MQENVEDFEPTWNWHKEEERDVIDFHVPGFEKEQLRVHVTGYGMLKVSGDRSIDKGKRRRFQKELKLVAENYKWDNIRAKLSYCGTLQIIVPLKVSRSVSSKEKSIVSPIEKEKKNGDERLPTVEPTNGENQRQAPGSGVKFGDSLKQTYRTRAIWPSVAVIVTMVVIVIGVYMGYKHWHLNSMDIKY